MQEAKPDRNNRQREEACSDWNRLNRMRDDEIDFSDSPEVDETWFRNAYLRLPGEKLPRPVHLDAKVLAWYQSRGDDWQGQINEVLRRYMEQHESSTPA